MAAPTIFSNPLTPGQIPDEFLLLGSMREWFMLEDSKTPPAWVSEVFNVKPSDQLTEYEWSMVGLPLHQEVLTPGAPPATAQRGKAYRSSWTARDFSLSTETHQNVIVDDKHGFAKLEENSRGLARSARRTKNHHAIAALEGGFASNWNATEALPLFSATHPLAPGAATPPSPHAAGYGDNLVSAGLAIASMWEGIEKLQTCPDAQGNPQDMTEDGITLIVPTVLAPLAHQIVESPGLYNSPNLSMNWLKDQGIKIQVISILTSSVKWYLRCGLGLTKGIWFDREQPNTSEDYDKTKTRFYTQTSFMRYSYGWGDWRGWIGGTP